MSTDVSRAGDSHLSPRGEVTGDAPENVEGKRLTPTPAGFGETYRKRFSVPLPACEEPSSVMRSWKEEFASFWPEGQRFYAPYRGLQPGEVAAIELSGPAGAKLSTGVVVVGSDATSLTLMTPQGHMFAGWNRFSVARADRGCEARIDLEVRPNDPLYQVLAWLGAYRREDEFWTETLENVARRFEGVPAVRKQSRLVSRRFNWSAAKNVVHNAGIRTTVHRVTGLFRRAGTDARG